MPIPVDSYPKVPTATYDALRDNIRSGDILMCSGNATISKIIQQATKSVWSHVAFIIRLDNINRVLLLESVETMGVRTVPLSSYANNYNGTGKGYPGKILLARHREFKNDRITDLSKAAVDLLGYPYGTEELLRIAARITLADWHLDEPTTQLTPQKAYICSEYAYECYKSVGVSIDYNPKGFVAPADFARTEAIDAVSFIKTF